MKIDPVKQQLLHMIQHRVKQLRVRSPGEAKELFLSRIDDSNPIKDLLQMKAQRIQASEIENRLHAELEAKLEEEI